MASDRVRVLLVAGTGQNGATLLSRVLGGIPGFVAIGEIGHLWDKALIDGRECGCGRLVGTCPFWSKVGREAFGGWDSVDARRASALRGSLLFKKRSLPHPFALPFILHPGLSSRYRRNLEAYGELMERLYRAIATVSSGRVIVDSMKVPAHVYAMALRPGIDARVVHLVRDARGVAYSNVKVVKRQGADFRVRRRPTKASARWMWINESFRVLARQGGVPTLVVRYESFVSSPARAVERIADFAGVPLGPGALDGIDGTRVKLPEDHLVAGNRMRFESGVIQLRVDDAWREQLKPGQRRAATLVAWPLLRRYGYEPASPAPPGPAAD